MVYCGCRGFCAKSRWALFTLSFLAAAALLVAGLIKTVPELTTLFKCTTRENSLQDSGVCWKAFWDKNALFFILTCIGAGCLLVSLLTCCCFCCASAPAASKKSKKNQGQFIQGEHAAYDTAPQGDQFNYGAAPANTKGVAHV